MGKDKTSFGGHMTDEKVKNIIKGVCAKIELHESCEEIQCRTFNGGNSDIQAYYDLFDGELDDGCIEFEATITVDDRKGSYDFCNDNTATIINMVEELEYIDGVEHISFDRKDCYDGYGVYRMCVILLLK